MRKFIRKITYIFNPSQKAIDEANLRRMFELEVEKVADGVFKDYKETFKILADSDKNR